MTTNGQPLNERQLFDELLGDNRFDDSVRDGHQGALRSKVLQAYDAPKSEESAVEVLVRSNGTHQHRSWKRSLAYATIVAACLIGFLAIWLFPGSGSDEHPIVDNPETPEITVDPQLLAALAQVNSYRDEVSPEELFSAIAMCELDHQGRTMFDSVHP